MCPPALILLRINACTRRAFSGVAVTQATCSRLVSISACYCSFHDDADYCHDPVEIAECALAIALEKHSLPKLGQKGGVLTPMSALGDVLIRRLERSGRFEFEQYMIDEQGRRA
jgi:short subunit dehydrogenase-like uncharacterized protein